MAMAEMRQVVAVTLRVGWTGEFGTTITTGLLYAFCRNPQANRDVVFLSSRQPFCDLTAQALDRISHWESLQTSALSAGSSRSRHAASLPAPTTSPGTAHRQSPTICPVIAAWSFACRRGAILVSDAGRRSGKSTCYRERPAPPSTTVWSRILRSPARDRIPAGIRRRNRTAGRPAPSGACRMAFAQDSHESDLLAPQARFETLQGFVEFCIDF